MAQDLMNKHWVAEISRVSAVYGHGHILSGEMDKDRDNGEIVAIGDYKEGEYYTVGAFSGDFEAKVVINSAGLYSDKIAKMLNVDHFEIKPRKGEYFVLDHFNKPFISHVIFPTPTAKGKGILVTPTTHGNYLVGPSSEFVDDKDDFSRKKLKRTGQV